MSDDSRVRAKSMANNFRKWKKVIEPIVKYNRNSSSLGYPLDFIFQLQKLFQQGLSLRLNIPTTLSGTKDNCLKTVFASESEEIGKIVFTPSMLKSNFDYQVEKQMIDRVNKLSQKDRNFLGYVNDLKQNNIIDQILPCVLVKQKLIDERNGIELHTYVLNKDQYKKISNIEVNQITQCFIFANSKSASIIRFFYYPQKHNSIAFKIDNSQVFTKKRNYKTLWKVKQENEHSLTFVKIMFVNKSFYKQTHDLVKFLQLNLKITISKIVCDWILDANNRYFLVDIKEVVFQKNAQGIKIETNLIDCLSIISCSVCQQKFKASEITKILTSKIIWEFFEHIKKRQIVLSFQPHYRYSSNTVKVCELCYNLVVAENKLTELELCIAKATHATSLKDLDGQAQFQDKMRKKIGGDDYRQRCLQQMYEWRLFFYFQDIRELQLQDWEQKHSYYVMIKIHNSVTSFKLKLKDPSSSHISIKGIKIHYLFSQSDKIEKFLTKTQITIRITNQNNWNSVIAEGNTSGLYEESEKYSMRKFKQILVFDAQSKYSVVGLHIGIKLEGKYNSQSLKLSKFFDAYMVDDEYSNSYSLPAEWMETIDPSYCINKTANSNFQYSMHLSPEEKKLLLPMLKPHRNSKKLEL